MGFYLRCRRLQFGAAAQADSGGLLMDKLPRFAKVFAGRRRIVEMDISLRLRNLVEFFNSLLDAPGHVPARPPQRAVRRPSRPQRTAPRSSATSRATEIRSTSVVSGFVLSEAQHPHCARSTDQRRYPRHSLATCGQNTAIIQIHKADPGLLPRRHKPRE